MDVEGKRLNIWVVIFEAELAPIGEGEVCGIWGEVRKERSCDVTCFGDLPRTLALTLNTPSPALATLCSLQGLIHPRLIAS